MKLHFCKNTLKVERNAVLKSFVLLNLIIECFRLAALPDCCVAAGRGGGGPGAGGNPRAVHSFANAPGQAAGGCAAGEAASHATLRGRQSRRSA